MFNISGFEKAPRTRFDVPISVLKLVESIKSVVSSLSQEEMERVSPKPL